MTCTPILSAQITSSAEKWMNQIRRTHYLDVHKRKLYFQQSAHQNQLERQYTLLLINYPFGERLLTGSKASEGVENNEKLLMDSSDG